MSVLQLSVIIPVYNEAGTVLSLAAELTAVLEESGREFEVIWIDDGSADETPQLLVRVSEWDSRHRAYRLPRNTHKSGALQAGFDLAGGAVVVTMDGDGQDDPRCLPDVLAALERGADVVIGWRQSRADPLSKRLTSRVFNALTSALLGRRLRDMNSGFKAFGAAAVAAVSFSGSLYRFVPHLLAAGGHQVIEVPVTHRPRQAGRTKFTLRHRCRALLDLVTVMRLMRGQQKPLALSRPPRLSRDIPRRLGSGGRGEIHPVGRRQSLATG
jgi:glycosyltransferase involved in cell wall biosynthesis